MRTIERSTAVKRDCKREAKGEHRSTLDADLAPVLAALASDQPLQPRHRDHELSGEWGGYRECHVKPGPVSTRRTSPCDIIAKRNLALRD